MYGHLVELRGDLENLTDGEKDDAFQKAEEGLREALKDEGFGVVSEVDVGATLNQKLDVNFPRYKILGACNPGHAYDALTEEKQLGLMLPCNVVIYEESGALKASAVRAEDVLGSIVENDALTEIAEQVDDSLKRALEAAT